MVMPLHPHHFTENRANPPRCDCTSRGGTRDVGGKIGCTGLSASESPVHPPHRLLIVAFLTWILSPSSAILPLISFPWAHHTVILLHTRARLARHKSHQRSPKIAVCKTLLSRLRETLNLSHYGFGTLSRKSEGFRISICIFIGALVIYLGPIYTRRYFDDCLWTNRRQLELEEVDFPLSLAVLDHANEHDLLASLYICVSSQYY